MRAIAIALAKIKQVKKYFSHCEKYFLLNNDSPLTKCTPCGVQLIVPSGLPPQKWDFNPRTPCGVRQGDNYHAPRVIEFQSTHSMRSATAIFRK